MSCSGRKVDLAARNFWICKWTFARPYVTGWVVPIGHSSVTSAQKLSRTVGVGSPTPVRESLCKSWKSNLSQLPSIDSLIFTHSIENRREMEHFVRERKEHICAIALQSEGHFFSMEKKVVRKKIVAESRKLHYQLVKTKRCRKEERGKKLSSSILCFLLVHFISFIFENHFTPPQICFASSLIRVQNEMAMEHFLERVTRTFEDKSMRHSASKYGCSEKPWHICEENTQIVDHFYKFRDWNADWTTDILALSDILAFFQLGLFCLSLVLFHMVQWEVFHLRLWANQESWILLSFPSGNGTAISTHSEESFDLYLVISWSHICVSECYGENLMPIFGRILVGCAGDLLLRHISEKQRNRDPMIPQTSSMKAVKMFSYLEWETYPV